MTTVLVVLHLSYESHRSVRDQHVILFMTPVLVVLHLSHKCHRSVRHHETAVLEVFVLHREQRAKYLCHMTYEVLNGNKNTKIKKRNTQVAVVWLQRVCWKRYTPNKKSCSISRKKRGHLFSFIPMQEGYPSIKKLLSEKIKALIMFEFCRISFLHLAKFLFIYRFQPTHN